MGSGSICLFTGFGFGLKPESSNSSSPKGEDFFSYFLLSFLTGGLGLGLNVNSSSYSSSLKREFFF
jgi:hypothetical protein